MTFRTAKSRTKWISDCGHFVIRRYTVRGYLGLGFEVLKDGQPIGTRWLLSEAKKLAAQS